ncbi:MAG: hypothetical protein HYV66_01345 [Candidatus Sungbacteria bacterium]|uniref:HTH HARE-type domain-containing protein n=1 Tax=Candidatus Sungiibacteriota bacterium TaxID=2750080 RepID=A0A931YDC6_9BACT|nr:hypothetical protein [Candidatus Sungbacteria bacterium]
MVKFEIKKIINRLVENLSDRSRDVILSRFGIGRDDYETLEAIGQRYGITRERVRQIEADALKHIKSPTNEGVIKPVVSALNEFVKSRGGVMEEVALKADFASNHFETKPEPLKKYEGATMFFLHLAGNFTRTKEDDDFWPRWALDNSALKNQEGLVNYLIGQFKKEKKAVPFDEFMGWTKKYNPAPNADTVLAFLASTKNVAKNSFGEWGLISWAEISPRGVRDKAYLVMKRIQKPLHFTEVAAEINKASFSQRVALPQTVHNELIKDGRFVLVGRGLYALKDWGYEAGTVKDVIKSVLSANGPMNREEVIKAVLSKRISGYLVCDICVISYSVVMVY